MTTEGISNIDKTRPVVTALLQNLPVPSGYFGDTLSQDYEEGRFFRFPPKDVRGQGRNIHAPTFFDLYDLLDTCLKQLSQEKQFDTFFEYDIGSTGESHSIAFALHNWIVSSSPEENPAPLEVNIQNSPILPNVLQFCHREGVFQYLLIAIELAQKHFPSIYGKQIELEQDPDTGEEWIILDVTIDGEVAKLLKNYDRYTDDWISSVPWPERTKVRFSYNII